MRPQTRSLLRMHLATKVSSQADFDYLSLPELSPDLHSVEMPSRVGAAVVVSYPDFLYNITNVFQLLKENNVLFLNQQATLF